MNVLQFADLSDKRTRISEIPTSEYEDFKRYCDIAGKIFLDELTSVDYVAYRSQYGRSREEIKMLRLLLEDYNKTDEDSGVEKGVVEESTNESNTEDNADESVQSDADAEKLSNVLYGEKDIGVDFCTLLLDEMEAKQYAQIISDMLENFCHKTNIVSNLGNYARRCVETLSADILSSQLSLWVTFYSKEKLISLGEDWLPFMEENITVKDFALVSERIVSGKSSSTNLNYTMALAEQISSFGKWLSMIDIDIKSIVSKLFDFTDLKEQRIWEIFKNRASGMTLEAIGLAMGGLTRERVRQIEKKALQILSRRFSSSVHNIFGLISILRNGNNFLQKHELEEIIGTEYTELLWYCLSCKNIKKDRYWFDTQFSHYDDKYDLVIITIDNSNETVNSKHIHSETFKFVGDLPALLETELLEKKILEMASEQSFPVEICRLVVDEVYKKAGKFSYKGRLTVIQMCDYILKHRFQNGYKIADEMDSKMFLRYMEEMFDSCTTAHAIDAKIMDIGVLFDRGKYIHRDYIHVEQSVVDAIFQYIDENPRTVLTYMDIFAALNDLFAGTPVTNRYILQGVMKLHNCKYESHKDYITKDGGGNVADELTSFVQSKGIVHKSEIFEEFIGWKDYNLSFVLLRCPEIISIDGGYFMHSSLIKLDGESVENIHKYLLSCINDIPVSVRYLYDEFMIRFADFMIENDLQTHGKLFGVLQYIYRSEFYFSRPYIAKENIGTITNKSVLLKHIEDVDSIEIEDFVDICDQNAVHYVSKSQLLNMMQPELLKIDENTLMKREKIGLTEEIMQEVSDLINEAISGHRGYIASKMIDDFSWYPLLEVPWTPFLLESIAEMIPTGVHMVMLQSSSMEIPHAIFVSDEYEDDDWNSLLVKLLKKEHDAEPFRTKNEMLKWLQKEGLCNVNFPAFLEAEHHVYEDENGKLVVE